jgi:hypothetical protein
VFAVTENVSVGIGTLAALLERLAYNIMLVKDIFKIHFKLLQVYYWLKDFWNPYLDKYLNFLKPIIECFCLFIILTRLQIAFYMSSFWHLTFRANFSAGKVAPNGERRKLANEQAGESQESRLFRRSCWIVIYPIV